MELRITFITPEASPTVSEALGALIGRTVDMEADAGYPTVDVHVLRVDGDGDLVVCETDDMGAPIINSTWAVPQASIRAIRVPLGDCA